MQSFCHNSVLQRSCGYSVHFWTVHCLSETGDNWLLKKVPDELWDIAGGYTCNARDPGDGGSIPGSGRSPGGGNGTPLQYSCLENPMDRERSMVGCSPWGRKELDMTEHITFPNMFLTPCQLCHSPSFLLGKYSCQRISCMFALGFKKKKKEVRTWSKLLNLAICSYVWLVVTAPNIWSRWYEKWLNFTAKLIKHFGTLLVKTVLKTKSVIHSGGIFHLQVC